MECAIPRRENVPAIQAGKGGLAPFKGVQATAPSMVSAWMANANVTLAGQESIVKNLYV